MKKVVLMLVCWLTSWSLPLWAETETGWQRIQQPNFSIIFPTGLDHEAQRVAGLLNQYLAMHLEDMPLEGEFKPVPIVLFTDSHTSNGNVGVPPLRSHWYNKPAALTGTEWFDTLAVHEGRHMVQYNQLFDHETGRIFHLLSGESGIGLMSGLFFPRWYYEGDAVVAETEMTLGGRGRSASFDLWFRTDLLVNGAYSYERAMLGTGFDRLPYQSPYVLGYFFNQYLQDNYNRQILDRVVGQTATFDALTFDEAFLNETGVDINTLYQRMITTLATQWQAQQNELNPSPVENLHVREVDHWQSRYPIGLSKEGVYAVEVDIEQGTFLAEVVDGKTARLQPLSRRVSGAYTSGVKSKQVFTAGSAVCWVVEKEHPRKTNAQAADLECWTAEGGVETKIARRKMTSANYADGQFLVHEFSRERTSQLVLYSDQGEEIASLELPARSLAYDISPGAGGWVFVLQTDEGHGIFHVNGGLTDLTLLKAAEGENVRSPLLTNHWLLYTSDYTGIDQVMALSRNSFETFQIATRPYGSYFLTLDSAKERLIMADYSAQGQSIVAIEFHDEALAPFHWIPVTELQPSARRTGLSVRQKPLVSSANASAEPYNPKAQLWNPHSWFGYYDGDILQAGIQSTDVFRSLDLNANLGFHFGADDWFGAVNGIYRGDSGTLFGYTGQKAFAADERRFFSHSLVAAWPNVRSKINRQQQRTPQVGLQWIDIEDEEAMAVVSSKISFVDATETAYQSLSSPFALTQTFQAQATLQTGDYALYSESGLLTQGLTNRQSLGLNLEAQYKVDDAISVMDTTTLFPDSVDEAWATRAQVNYQINLGPVGKRLTKALYWRNTDLFFDAQGQWQTSLDSVVGLGLRPNINLFRNEYLVISPRFSAYYRLQDAQWQAYFSLEIGDP